MFTRRVKKEDAFDYWELRLRALKEYPEAFASSYEESVNKPVDEVTNRIPETDNNYILGAFNDNKMIGMVGFKRETSKKLEHKAVIWGMYIAPEYQGRGIGRNLVEEVIGKAKLMGSINQINLTVVTSNEQAKKLYQSLGFQQFGIERKALKVGKTYYDEEMMVLMLN
jgi:ribosomal protein S18 acetylase RimI-like enzyme